MADASLSVDQGYAATIEFLTAFWERGGKNSEDIGELIMWMTLHADGVSFDPAMQQDWADAIDRVLTRQSHAKGV